MSRPIKIFKCLEINMYVYDEGVRRSVRGLGYPLSEEFYYYNESLAGLWQGIWQGFIVACCLLFLTR